jgi:hypothetical protein
VGENIFWNGSTGVVSAQTPVNLWASEGQKYDVTTNACGSAVHSIANFGCGHYTQLVWRTTVKVGCAMSNGCGSPDVQPWVCDYLPAGNLVDNDTMDINRPY